MKAHESSFNCLEELLLLLSWTWKTTSVYDVVGRKVCGLRDGLPVRAAPTEIHFTVEDNSSDILSWPCKPTIDLTQLQALDLSGLVLNKHDFKDHLPRLSNLSTISFGEMDPRDDSD